MVVEFEKQGQQLAIITLNRPEAGNGNLSTEKATHV